MSIPEASGEYTSRKFFLAMFSILLITAISALAIWFPGLQAILPVFTGGLLGVLSLYMTGNIMNKFVVGKTLKQIDPQE